MKKRILAILLAVLMVLSLMPTTVFADGNVAQIGTDKYPSLADAIAAAADGTPTTITMIADETFEGNMGVIVPAAKIITLDLAGYTLDGKKNIDSVITVNGNLTLIDSSEPSTGKITGGAAYSYGGGVYVNGGSFTMTGGTISGNTANNYGGGVYVNGGSFTMTGGTISGNKASKGGGVYVDGGSFTMTGGTISGNTASDGGGVYANVGSFTMTGGTISGNTTTSTSGGGVYVKAGFTMTGGTISGNTAYSYGGGVFAYKTSSVILGGTATVRGNEGSQHGLKESNIHLQNNMTTIVKVSTETPLVSGADIGLTLYLKTTGSWATGTEVGSYLGGTMTDSNYIYFVMNNSGNPNMGTLYGIAKDTENSQYDLVDHVHAFTGDYVIGEGENEGQHGQKCAHCTAVGNWVDHDFSNGGVCVCGFISVTDYHILNGTCDSLAGEGGKMGHQYKIVNSEVINDVGRAIICLTEEQLDAITADTVTVVGGDLGKETTITLDCAYTYFCSDEKKYTAEEIGCAAFLIIDHDATEGAISGFGYYAVYNGDSIDLIVDALYANPNTNK